MAASRKEILAEILDELRRTLMRHGFVQRIDNIFFRVGDCGCVQRDVVYYGSKRHGLDFELLSLDWSYFTGSKNHAMALKEALGGRIYPSEYVSCVDGMDLWIWEGPERKQQQQEARRGMPHCLDFETVKAALFDSES